ncbi:MAG: PQQ-like beta-propeller repeat protein, partial [Acidobacteriota bacterium]|nr:PQQ-like beta-propeller repeat protein [Acidobacteriota bacterium]
DIAARQYLWNTELGMDVVSNIVINKNSLYLVGKIEKTEKSENGESSRKRQSYFLKEINKLTGLTNRQTELNLPAGADEKFFLDIKKERIIAVGRSGGVYFFNNADGSLAGNLQSGKNVSSVPFFSDNEIIAGTSDDKIIIIPFDGSVPTATATAKTVSAVISTPDGKIIYGDRHGGVTALNKSDKIKIWKFRAGAEISDITQTPFGALISSFDNYVYLISTADGKLVWKKRMPGRTFARPLVRDGFAVIANLYEPEAEIVELKTGRIVNRLFLETENYFDGAVFLFEHSLVFSTLKGLTGFTAFPGKCAES